MEVRKGYKQTEVGIIPEDWSLKQLRDVATYHNGKSYEDKVDETGDYFLITLDSLDIRGKLKPNHKKVSRVDIPLSKNDLIMILSDVAHGYFLGLTDLIPENEKYILNQRIGVLKASSNIDPRFLSFFINHHQSYFKIAGQGSSQQNLSKSDIVNFNILVPTLAEQEAIAEALNDADALIEAVEQLLTKKRQVKQGAMSDLLTGKRRLSGFEKKLGYKQTEIGLIPEDWDVVSLGQKLRRIPTYGINAAAVPFDYRFPTYLRITDITDDGRFAEATKASVNHPLTASYLLEPNDIVFARTGASVGKSYLYNPKDGQLVFAGFLIRISPNPNELIPAFLKFFVQSRIYWKWIKTNSMRSGQPGINGREYASLPIPIPPTLAEQTAIAEILSDMDAEISALEGKLVKARQVKAGMMSELLTGKIRLV